MQSPPAHNPYSAPPRSAGDADDDEALLPLVCKVVLEVDILFCAFRAWSAAMAWLGEPISAVEWISALAIGVAGIRGNWLLLKGRRSGQLWVILALAITLISIAAEAWHGVWLLDSANLLPGIRNQRVVNIGFWACLRAIWWLQCVLILSRLAYGARLVAAEPDASERPGTK